jgi:hypothetical protein
MQEFKAGELVVLLRAMREAAGNAKPKDTVCWPLQLWETIKDNARIVCEELERLNLPVSLDKARLALVVLENEVGRDNHDQFGELVTLSGLPLLRYQAATAEAIDRFRSEMGAFYAFALNASEKALYEQKSPLFGEAVEAKFPKSRTDIEEAGRCLALARHTACVFHVMRAAEAAVAVLCKRVKASTKDHKGETLSWGTLTENMRRQIDKMPNGAKKDEWFKVHMFLQACNRAFRTKTAHPISKYTEEEAKEAFDATRAFMRIAAALR